MILFLAVEQTGLADVFALCSVTAHLLYACITKLVWSLQVCRPNICTHFEPVPCVLYAPLVSLSLI